MSLLCYQRTQCKIGAVDIISGRHTFILFSINCLSTFLKPLVSEMLLTIYKLPLFLAWFQRLFYFKILYQIQVLICIIFCAKYFKHIESCIHTCICIDEHACIHTHIRFIYFLQFQVSVSYCRPKLLQGKF